jgi:hypothetical protein
VSAGQWAHLAQAWPGLLASAFARCDPGDAGRWALLEGMDAAAEAAGAARPDGAPTVGTRAALGLLDDVARHASSAAATAALATVRAASGGALVAGPTGPAADEDGQAAAALVGTGRPMPATGSGDLSSRLEAIRATRPWPTNPVFEHVIAGRYRPEQLAVFLDQWQLHLLTGPSLFAGILGNLPAGHPDRPRLMRDVVAGAGIGGAPDHRTHLASMLRSLREALTGEPSASPVRPLVETRGHLGLMRSITRGRSAEEGFAAVAAVKPGFSATCARIADALVTHYGVTVEDAAFFTSQAARGDEGEREHAAIERVAGRHQVSDDAIAIAFADGLVSYHLILDGCHRAALAG